jgi:preprotein translocase subunit YajC
MSNSKNAIQEIKKLMVQFGFMAEQPTLKSFKLEDNTILETKDLIQGEEITKINDQFERVALENGSFRLVENFEIEVKDGKIETVKEIFLDAKLADGTVVKVSGDSLVEGAKVVVVTEDAEIPAPDGVHELEDGTKVETKDGIIAKVEEVVDDLKEGEKPEVEIEVSKEYMEKDMLDMLKEFIYQMGDKVKKMEEQMSSLSSDFNSFKKEPAAKKIANGKTDFNKSTNNNDDALQSKLDMIAELRKNNK